ncbi:hypothetical protein AB205_0168740 [Aquarana catesbeiana]|uniref:Uncharacterized protein n=1 Tax=Aquarana catesbeiana TaxID=8400 RepID=A0A2G9RHY2_AQUCT|nr:hypothetical protein AB205_0168740 [Aquarana catesbeiana]
MPGVSSASFSILLFIMMSHHVVGCPFLRRENNIYSRSRQLSKEKKKKKKNRQSAKNHNIL